MLIPNLYFDSTKEEFININAISDDGFINCKDITYVYMSNNLFNIGERAFANCVKLKEVSISESITKIDKFAFYSCSSLEEISIPKECETIGSYAFYGCDSLESANFLDSDSWVFSEYNIPVSKDTLSNTTNAARALKNLYTEAELRKIKNSDPLLNVKYINLDLTNDYTCKLPLYCNQTVDYRSENPSIATVENNILIPKSVGTTHIYATNAYGKRASIEVHVYNEGLFTQYNNLVICNGSGSAGIVTPPEKIGDTDIKGICLMGFFQKHVKEIYIPDCYEIISPQAFGINAIEYIRFGINSKLQSIGINAFMACKKLKYINIPDTVKTISGKAFQFCESLKYIHLPSNSSFISINEQTFQEAGLVSIVIPKNVNTIRNKAFYQCTNLKDIYYQGTVTEMTLAVGSSKDVFTGVAANVVHCSDGDYTISK